MSPGYACHEGKDGLGRVQGEGDRQQVSSVFSTRFVIIEKFSVLFGKVIGVRSVQV